MKNQVLAKASAAGALVVLYFLLLAHRGLNAFFTGDDFMNIAFLHGYGRVPLRVIFVEALSVFTPDYRPVGGLYYRTMFELFGLHPIPFRIVFFTLLIVNIVLAGLWFRRLSGSLLTAASAALLFSFHPAMAQLYYDGGTIYDVLCAFFFLLLLVRYAVFREAGYLTGNRLLTIAVLYGLALGSKEMAVTVPAVLALYEIVFHPEAKNWILRLRPILLLSLVTLVYGAVKLLVPSQMNINPGYVPHLSAAFIGNAYLHYYRLLILSNGLTGGVLAGGVVLALGVAIALQSRTMIFGLLFANLALLPVCAIPFRGGFVWYLPVLGIALYLGSALSLLADKLALAGPLRAQPIQPVLFVLLVSVSYAFYFRSAERMYATFAAQQEEIEILAILKSARAAAPTLPHAARVLFENDPHAEAWWLPLFIFRLNYRDPAIWVERVSRPGGPHDPADVSLYDMRMHWDGSRYAAFARPRAANPLIYFRVVPDAPDVLGNVRRGQTARILLPPSFGGCRIDVAYRMRDDELMREGTWLNWMEVDASGQGRFRADGDAERGRVAIDRIRACGGQWLPADASFVTDP